MLALVEGPEDGMYKGPVDTKDNRNRLARALSDPELPEDVGPLPLPPLSGVKTVAVEEVEATSAGLLFANGSIVCCKVCWSEAINKFRKASCSDNNC